MKKSFLIKESAARATRVSAGEECRSLPIRFRFCCSRFLSRRSISRRTTRYRHDEIDEIWPFNCLFTEKEFLIIFFKHLFFILQLFRPGERKERKLEQVKFLQTLPKRCNRKPRKRFNALRVFGARERSLFLSRSISLRHHHLKCLLHPVFIPTMVAMLPRATMLHYFLTNISSLSSLLPQPLLPLLSSLLSLFRSRQGPGSWGWNSQHLSSLLPSPLIRSLGNSTVPTTLVRFL